MDRRLVMIGAIIMFLGVGAGAFGAHALSGYFAHYPEFEGTYETAVRYQMMHGLGMLLTAVAVVAFPGKLPRWAGWLFLLGIGLFSGSLYLLVFTRISWLGAITPLGGVAFLAGWALLFLAALRSPQRSE